MAALANDNRQVLKSYRTGDDQNRGPWWELGAGRGYRREQLGSSLQTGIRKDGGGFNVLSRGVGKFIDPCKDVGQEGRQK